MTAHRVSSNFYLLLMFVTERRTVSFLTSGGRNGRTRSASYDHVRKNEKRIGADEGHLRGDKTRHPPLQCGKQRYCIRYV